MSYLIRPVQEAKEGVFFVVKNWKMMLFYGFIMSIVYLDKIIASLVPGFEMPLGWLVSLTLFVFTVLAMPVFMIYINSVMKGENAAIRTCVKYAAENMNWYLLYYFIFVVIVLFSFSLLIIPGLYFMTVFQYAQAYTVLEKKDNTISPLKISRILVRGEFWPVFLIGLVSVAAFIGVDIALREVKNPVYLLTAYVIFLFLLPVIEAVYISVYRKLSAQKAGQITPEKVKRMGGGLGCFLLLLMVVMPMVIMVVAVVQLGKTEMYKKLLSKPLIVGGQAELVRPQGWMISKIKGRYYLGNSLFKRNDPGYFEEIDVAESGFTGKELEISNRKLAQELLYDYVVLAYASVMIKKESCLPAKLDYHVIDGWKWAAAEVSYKSQSDIGDMTYYKILYTIQGDKIYKFSYLTNIRGGHETEDETAIKNEEKIFMQMIDGLDIPSALATAHK